MIIMRVLRQLQLYYKLSSHKPDMEQNVRIYKEELKNNNTEKEFLESHHSETI